MISHEFPIMTFGFHHLHTLSGLVEAAKVTMKEYATNHGTKYLSETRFVQSLFQHGYLLCLRQSSKLTLFCLRQCTSLRDYCGGMDRRRREKCLAKLERPLKWLNIVKVPKQDSFHVN